MVSPRLSSSSVPHFTDLTRVSSCHCSCLARTWSWCRPKKEDWLKKKDRNQRRPGCGRKKVEATGWAPALGPSGSLCQSRWAPVLGPALTVHCHCHLEIPSGRAWLGVCWVLRPWHLESAVLITSLTHSPGQMWPKTGPRRHLLVKSVWHVTDTDNLHQKLMLTRGLMGVRNALWGMTIKTNRLAWDEFEPEVNFPTAFPELEPSSFWVEQEVCRWIVSLPASGWFSSGFARFPPRKHAFWNN